MTLSREEMEARYRVFDRFALKDQRAYYQSTVQKHRLAARQVNKIRAWCAFFTGLFAAASGLIVQAKFVSGAQCALSEMGMLAPPDCSTWKLIVSIFMIFAVVTPALGAFFGTLADLYQWDRLVEIYDTALENIEFTGAHYPDPEMDDEMYKDYLRVYAEGTLSVMQDETAQWGQSVRTPEEISEFIRQQNQRAEQVRQTRQTPDSNGE